MALDSIVHTCARCLQALCVLNIGPYNPESAHAVAPYLTSLTSLTVRQEVDSHYYLDWLCTVSRLKEFTMER